MNPNEKKTTTGLIPILVRSPGGRCGTSLMMEVLGSSSQIAFDRRHPYESRMLSYFFRHSRVPFSDKKPKDWNNDLLVRGELQSVGPIPTKTDYITDNQKFCDKLFVSAWKTFSNSAQEYAPECMYYAEKIPHDILPKIQRILSTKTIYLVRDPRAELSSILSFNAKRNSNFFGWKSEDTIKSFAERFAKSRTRYLNFIESLEKNDEHLVVKYEDLILKGDEVAQAVSSFLGITVSLDLVEKNLNSNAKHMTSSAPEGSLHKWKTHLSDEIQSFIYRKVVDKTKIYE